MGKGDTVTFVPPADFAARLRAAADAKGRISEIALRDLAAAAGCTLLEAQQQACAAGVLPERYARNMRQLTLEQQGRLLAGRVLLVGLGGLGGHVLDMLTRMGVGRIAGADGDVFEESNVNRQMLADMTTLGRPKTEAAACHVLRVNPAVQFTPLEMFLRGSELEEAACHADVVVDALGGLGDRSAVEEAAARAGVPLVTAGIAGLTGWCMVVRPGEHGPACWLGRSGGGVEEQLGNLAPTAAMAAALQSAEILKLLAGLPIHSGMIIFDMEDQTLYRIQL